MTGPNRPDPAGPAPEAVRPGPARVGPARVGPARVGAAPVGPAPVRGAGGQPTAEELAAILAAVEVLWPRAAVALPVAEEPLSLRWRFSGRWWTRSVISRRDRPWVGPQP